MEHIGAYPGVPIGLLLVQGGWLPQHLRVFLEPGRVEGINQPLEAIDFFILPSASVIGAVQQGLVPCPALWVDQDDAIAGAASLRVAYRFGGDLQARQLPFRPIKLQPVRKGAQNNELVAYRSYIPAKIHLQLFRLTHLLFPALEQWHADLSSGVVTLLEHGNAGFNEIRAVCLEEGILLECHSCQSITTARAKIVINLRHACLELQDVDDMLNETATASAKCLRTLRSLDEAISYLQGQETQLIASPSVSPRSGSDGLLRMVFHSPSKAPRDPSRDAVSKAREGVTLLEACSSASLRDGAIMLQAAAATSVGVSAAVTSGAMEALITASATVLPSTIMGTIEQLTLISLTLSAILDNQSGHRGVERVVKGLAAAVSEACANPILLCKVAIALLQRSDVREEAIRLGLSDAFAMAYLRKSPLLEPLAAVLLGTSASPHLPPSPATRNTALYSSTKNVLGSSSSAEVSRFPRTSTSVGMELPQPAQKASRLPKPNVPRLSLPNQLPKDSGAEPPSAGLTRATRRELAAMPTDWRPSSTSHAPWSSPRGRSNSWDATAEAEMDALAEALGEGLMAADLPVIIAQRRAEGARDSEASDEDNELFFHESMLEQGTLPGTARAQPTLQAHRIFTSARSMRSLDSSDARSGASMQTADHGSDPDMRGASASFESPSNTMTSDPIEVKHLLLQAFMLALPPVQGLQGYLGRDPSPIMAAEILSLPSSGLSQTQTALRVSCLESLAQLALRSQSGNNGRPYPPATEHVLLVAIGNKLAQLLGTQGGVTQHTAQHGSHLMHLALEYLTLVDTPSGSTAVANHILGPVSRTLRACADDVSQWDAAVWQLLHGAFLLMTSSINQCRDAHAGRAYISAFLADYKAAFRVTSAAKELLLADGAMSLPALVGLDLRSPSLQRDILAFLVSLVNLVGRQTFVPGGEGPPNDAGADVLLLQEGANVRDQHRFFCRRRALNLFSFLVAPGNELLKRVLEPGMDHGGGSSSALSDTPRVGPPTLSAVRMRAVLFDMLRAVFAAPGNPYIADKVVADYYIRFHFIQFLKVYHNPHRDPQAAFLCRQHLGVLLALAGSTPHSKCNAPPHARHRFVQLSVVDFFMRELSLEYELSQYRLRPSSGTATDGSTPELLTLGVARAASAGRLQGAPRRMSPVASTQGVSHLSRFEQKHKRAHSMPGTDVLPLTTGEDSIGTGWSTPVAPVPRLRLHGSAGEATNASRYGSSPQLHPGSGLGIGTSASGVPLPPSSRRGKTPRRQSRLSRDTPPPQGAFTTETDSVRDGVPKLVLRGLGLTLDATHDDVDGRATPAGVSNPKPLDRVISGAVSLDKDWIPSTGSVNTGGMPAWKSDNLGLPTNFAFSGDLDDDVERLEELERLEQAEGSSRLDSHDLTEERESPAHPLQPLSKLELQYTDDSDTEEAQKTATSSPALPRLGDAVALLRVALKEDSSSPVPLANRPTIPRLAVTPSMHSTLEMRTATAEQHAREAENSRRQAGRSIFGDLERSALGKGKMQAATFVRRRHTSEDGFGGRTATPTASVVAASYADERAKRLMYMDDDLHLQALVLVFTLIIGPNGQLDTAYCDQYPWDRKLQNIPFLLHHHLNHPDTLPLLPRLLKSLRPLGSPAQRLLRTLCGAFFRPEWYINRTRISGVAGAYATIYRCTLPFWGDGSSSGTSVVLKVLDTPKHIQDRCAQVDFHSEVTILETLVGQPFACQMYDYGLDVEGDAMMLVLKDYRCSLKQWRAAQPAEPGPRLRLYYAIFKEVLLAVAGLLDSGVVHFDLKCDNVLLEPLPELKSDSVGFWAPQSTTRLPFRVVLADFGESKLLGKESLTTGFTTCRARGTDAFKSPEMLLVGGNAHRTSRGFDRRKRQGAGAASDVWSLGCLLYELVTGKLLFSDSDWLQLVARVTSSNMPLITEERASAVADLPGVLDLLQYLLVRDAAMRPTLRDAMTKLDAVLAVYGQSMGKHGVSDDGATAVMSSSSEGPLPQATPLRLWDSPLSGYPHGLQLGAHAPLPLVVPLPVVPGAILVGPASCLRRDILREESVTKVVILACQGERNHHHEAKTSLEVPLKAVLDDDGLMKCVEAVTAAGAQWVVLSTVAKSNADSRDLAAWVGAAVTHISRHDTDTGQCGRVMVVPYALLQAGDAVLLAVAGAVLDCRRAPYEAMVGAANVGLDRHMDAVQLEALRIVGENES